MFQVGVARHESLGAHVRGDRAPDVARLHVGIAEVEFKWSVLGAGGTDSLPQLGAFAESIQARRCVSAAELDATLVRRLRVARGAGGSVEVSSEGFGCAYCGGHHAQRHAEFHEPVHRVPPFVARRRAASSASMARCASAASSAGVAAPAYRARSQ